MLLHGRPIMRRTRLLSALLCVAAWLAFGIPMRASAATSPIRGFDPSNNARDFCVVGSGGTMHVFFINNVFGIGDVDIRHASSADLIHWSSENAALQPSNTPCFDSLHVWAPSIVQNPSDNFYYMFYTGVTNHGPPGQGWDLQGIGVATAPSLGSPWARLSAPCPAVVPCPGPPFACDPTNNPPNPIPPDWRDPFVMPDPDRPGWWLMYVAARSLAVPTKMTLAELESNGNLLSWTVRREVVDARPVNGKLESPHIIMHGGYSYLFYTTNTPGGCDRVVFRTKFGGPASATPWSTEERSVATELGDATKLCNILASDGFQFGGRDYLGFANYNGFSLPLEFNEILWGGGAPPSFKLSSNGREPATGYSLPSTIRGTTIQIVINIPNNAFGTYDAGWHGRFIRLQPYSLVGTSETPVTLPNFPTLVEATGPTTSVPWQTVLLNDSDWTLRVRSEDGASVILNSVFIHEPPPPPDPRETDPKPSLTPDRSSPAQLGVVAVAQAGGAGLRLTIPKDANYRVDVIDARGKIVALLHDGPLSQGESTWMWDGRDGRGRQAAVGVYFARVEGAGLRAATRFVLLR